MKVESRSLATLLLILYGFGLAIGCSHDGPPPHVPRPDVQKTDKGLEKARQLLGVLHEMDSTPLATMKSEVEKQMADSIRRADGDTEHDFAHLHYTISLVEEGDRPKAIAYLEALIERSESQVKPTEEGKKKS